MYTARRSTMTVATSVPRAVSIRPFFPTCPVTLFHSRVSFSFSLSPFFPPFFFIHPVRRNALAYWRENPRLRLWRRRRRRRCVRETNVTNTAYNPPGEDNDVRKSTPLASVYRTERFEAARVCAHSAYIRAMHVCTRIVGNLHLDCKYDSHRAAFDRRRRHHRPPSIPFGRVRLGYRHSLRDTRKHAPALRHFGLTFDRNSDNYPECRIEDNVLAAR